MAIPGECPSRAMRRVREYGRAIQDALGPDDPRLGGVVRLSHRDGTGMVLVGAFVRREGGWVYVFTRNHGFLAYRRDELTDCKAYEPPLTGAPDARPGGGSGVGFGDTPDHAGRPAAPPSARTAGPTWADARGEGVRRRRR